MPVRTAVICLLASACTLHAEQWLKLMSPHFELYSSASERASRDTIVQFERAREAFIRIHDESAANARVRIVLFGNPREFQPYSAGPKRTAAYHLTGEGSDYVVLNGRGQENDRVAIHEYSHVWLKHTGAKFPLWLNEGLAEVHSTLQRTEGKLWIGHAIEPRLEALRHKSWIPIDRLLAIDSKSPEYNEDDRAGMFYSESWLLVHMLQLSREFSGGWGQFVTALLATGSAEQAFARAWNKTPAEIFERLQRYSGNKMLDEVAIPVEVAIRAEELRIEPAPAFDTGMTLADILLLQERWEQADAAYADLAKQFPDRWEIAVARAAAEIRRGKPHLAKQHYARAVELKATDAKLHLEYAQMVIDEDPGRAAAALERAVEIEPGMQQAHEMLGAILHDRRDHERAVKHLLQVRETVPERAFRLYTLLADSQNELGRRQEAEVSAKRAQQLASTQLEKDAAAALLKRIAGDQGGPPPPVVAQRPKPILAEPTPELQVPVSRMIKRAVLPVSTIKGQFVALDCAGTSARMHISEGGRKHILTIVDPAMVLIKDGRDNSSKAEFVCGPQRPSPAVTVEYETRADAHTKSEGVVRILEFMK